MQTLSEQQLLTGLTALALVLVIGRGTAELAKRIGQPEVLGELLGGFLLGPSLFGALFPAIYHQLFSGRGVAFPLSMFSWTGAILLLLLAGLEIDLAVLKQHLKAGALTAALTIGASIILGTVCGTIWLELNYISAAFFGAVLSVTAVSVVAKILFENGVLRRNYAQVIMAAGIASEFFVWPLVSILSAAKEGDSWTTGVITTLSAGLFVVAMLTIGQKFIDWSMRRIVDFTQIIYGQLSLVVVLGIFFATLTQRMGLHALLGPFILGLLIGRAPRSTNKLKESIHSMTLSVFAPVFFVTAGMRVDILKVWSSHGLKAILVVLLVSVIAKVGFGFVGARFGKFGPWESLLIGLGVNMRGGSDVIVAILGGSIGLLSQDIYTIYAVVAFLTVLISPSIFSLLAKKVPPTKEEEARLTKEEAKKRAYLSGIERVLLPSFHELMPMEPIPVLKAIASTKELEKEIFDIVELSPQNNDEDISEVVSAALKEAGEAANVQYTNPNTELPPIEAVVNSAAQCDLVVFGARRPSDHATILTFGDLQNKIINTAKKDIFIMFGGRRLITRRINRIAVPVNGMQYSLAAADLAAYIAKATDAEVILINAVKSEKLKKKSLTYHRIRRAGLNMLQEAKFRTHRLDIRCQQEVIIAEDPDKELLAELKRGHYSLVIMGAIDRSNEAGLQLGTITKAILTQLSIPTGMLIVNNNHNNHNGK